MTWDMRGRAPPAAPLGHGDGDGRVAATATAVCLTHQTINRCQAGGRIEQAALSWDEKVVWHLSILFCVLPRGWLIGGHEIDEVHPGQSETIGSGLERAHWRRKTCHGRGWRRFDPPSRAVSVDMEAAK